MLHEEIGMEINQVIEDIENGNMDLEGVAKVLKGIVGCMEEEDNEPISEEERKALST